MPVTTTLLFLRHGKVDNPKGVLYGRLPGFRLSKTGRDQVIKSAKLLKNLKVSAVYSSPLLRARQTASIIGKWLNLKPRISSQLTEVKIIYQGMPLDLFKKNIQFHLYEPQNIKKGQESIAEISSRMLKFVKFIKKRHPGKTVLAVSHGDPIAITKAVINNKKFTWEYKKRNYLSTGKFLTLILR